MGHPNRSFSLCQQNPMQYTYILIYGYSMKKFIYFLGIHLEGCTSSNPCGEDEGDCDHVREEMEIRVCNVPPETKGVVRRLVDKETDQSKTLRPHGDQ